MFVMRLFFSIRDSFCVSFSSCFVPYVGCRYDFSIVDCLWVVAHQSTSLLGALWAYALDHVVDGLCLVALR